MIQRQVTQLTDIAKDSTTYNRTCQVAVEQYFTGGISLVVLDRFNDAVCGVLLELFNGELQIVVQSPDQVTERPQVTLKVNCLQDLLQPK